MTLNSYKYKTMINNKLKMHRVSVYRHSHYFGGGGLGLVWLSDITMHVKKLGNENKLMITLFQPISINFICF